MRLLAIIVTAGLLASPALANKFMPGSYTALLFDDHNTQPEKVCLAFNRTGKVIFRNSGTWTASHGGNGNYTFSNKYLRGYGTLPTRNGRTAVFNFFFDVDTGYGGFDEWHANLKPIADGRFGLDLGSNCF